MSSLLAPIALFVYNRPWHVRQTLESLKKNHLSAQSILYIFADGAKSAAEQNSLDRIAEVRKIIRQEQWCKEVHIIENEQNKGLANSIIEGVSQLVSQYGKVIVLEDDMITSPFFLQFMNEALDFYENEERVASIHAYTFNVANLPTTFFLRDPGCWGWATWARGWRLFEYDGSKLMKEIQKKKLIKEFNYENSYPYFLMLEKQVKGANDSWAIRWYASLFLKNKLTLYPCQSLVYNIGNDASGTHATGDESYFDVKVSQKAIPIQKIPIEANEIAYQKIVKFFHAHFPPPSLWRKLKNKVLAWIE
jgi:hypothetical protein